MGTRAPGFAGRRLHTCEVSQAPGFAGARLRGHQASRAGGFAGGRLRGHQDSRAPGFAGGRLRSRAGKRGSLRLGPLARLLPLPPSQPPTWSAPCCRRDPGVPGGCAHGNEANGSAPTRAARRARVHAAAAGCTAPSGCTHDTRGFQDIITERFSFARRGAGSTRLGGHEVPPVRAQSPAGDHRGTWASEVGAWRSPKPTGAVGELAANHLTLRINDWHLSPLDHPVLPTKTETL